MDDTILDINGLEVQFIDKDSTITAITDVSLKVYKGKTLGIVGESGCGKSVTATSIIGLLPKQNSKISSGEIIFDGVDLVKLSEKEMRSIRGNEIAMIFQNPMNSLNPVYTVNQQMSELRKAHKKISKKDSRIKNIEMLKMVGIPSPEKRVDEYPHQLSGGMVQRIMIAMALSADPKLLIADEPTTALDVTIQAQILDLMNNLKDKIDTSIIMITHDMGVIAEVADYVLIMYAGQTVEYAEVHDIFDKPLHPYTSSLLNSIPIIGNQGKKLTTIKGTVPSITNMPKGCRFYDRCDHRMEICKENEPPYYEIGERRVKCWLYSNRKGDSY